MAYGTASGPEDVERYYADIRGGRAPAPEQLRELRERYAAIGNVFPLLDITTAQARGLEEALNAGGELPSEASGNATVQASVQHSFADPPERDRSAIVQENVRLMHRATASTRAGRTCARLVRAGSPRS